MAPLRLQSCQLQVRSPLSLEGAAPALFLLPGCVRVKRVCAGVSSTTRGRDVGDIPISENSFCSTGSQSRCGRSHRENPCSLAWHLDLLLLLLVWVPSVGKRLAGCRGG